MSILVIAALACKQEDILIIENPEIHLHPRAQSRFYGISCIFSK